MKPKPIATSTVVLIVGMIIVAAAMFIPIIFDLQGGGLDEEQLVLQNGTELSCVVNDGYREGGLECFVVDKLDN